MYAREGRIGLSLPDPFTTLRSQMDDVFRRLFGEEAESSAGWYAPVAMWEDGGAIQLEVELPGVSKDDLEITVHQGTLRIVGTRKAPQEGRRYWHNERRFGRFERVLPLPEAVDPNSIEASLNQGVLSLRLSKKPEARPLKIAVK